MTYKIVGTEYVDYGSGRCWMTFATLTCDFCGKIAGGHDQGAEVDMIHEIADNDGWDHLRGTELWQCPDCHLRAFAEGQA